ncbi:hypothetical protein C7S16_7033 [Burkholderia thailandensis]|uniref:Uncharacterized protein n=1 Tax=Burkholderia thailandensis TaxID=57975 RepID=A0AAW9CIE9_BURTH|nr:hypothetical protein [Burkholderia thailandensis]MDW9250720.1 hypothetical protein [Burkholderia thailandensis]
MSGLKTRKHGGSRRYAPRRGRVASISRSRCPPCRTRTRPVVTCRHASLHF